MSDFVFYRDFALNAIKSLPEGIFATLTSLKELWVKPCIGSDTNSVLSLHFILISEKYRIMGSYCFYRDFSRNAIAFLPENIFDTPTNLIEL